ncbi:MAG: hypothetical protein HY908_35620, partial [Myxococcales bacterium]|nr:hypothetical protein [Myxococcales bacterium]
ARAEAAAAGSAPASAPAAHVEPPPPSGPDLLRLADPFKAAAPAGAAPPAAFGAAPPAEPSHPIALRRLSEPPAAAGEPRAASDTRLEAIAPPPDSSEGALSRRERRRRGRGRSPIVYAFIAMSAGFGAVAGYVLLSSRGGTTPGPVATAPGTAPVESGAPRPERSTAPSAEAEPTASAVVLDPVAVGPEPSGKPFAVASGAPAQSASGGAVAPPIDTSGFSSGPGSSDPAGPGPGPGLSDGLTQAQITPVVSRNRPIIKSSCWEPVLEGYGGNASAANVTVSLVVGPSGAVESASASGGSEFPSLASCIASRVRAWRFPPSGAATPVQVPFHFVVQR